METNYQLGPTSHLTRPGVGSSGPELQDLVGTNTWTGSSCLSMNYPNVFIGLVTMGKVASHITKVINCVFFIYLCYCTSRSNNNGSVIRNKMPDLL